MITADTHKLPLDLLRPKHWLSWLGLLIFLPVAYLPQRWRHALGRQLGQRLYQHNAKRRHIVYTNLSLCFPQQTPEHYTRLTQQYFQGYGCALIDYSILFFRSRSRLYQQVTLVGQQHIEQSLQHDRPVLLLLGHSIWLEFAPLALGQYYTCYGSYQPFKNAVLNWMIARSRLQDVAFVIPRTAGLMKLVRALQPGKLCFFLPDEDHGAKHSVFTDFFGVQKATLTTPSRLAKLTKADCLVVMPFLNPESKRYEVHISPVLENFGAVPAADTQQLNQTLVRFIKARPLQYMWTLKLFKTRPHHEDECPPETHKHPAKHTYKIYK